LGKIFHQLFLRGTTACQIEGCNTRIARHCIIKFLPFPVDGLHPLLEAYHNLILMIIKSTNEKLLFEVLRNSALVLVKKSKKRRCGLRFHHQDDTENL